LTVVLISSQIFRTRPDRSWAQPAYPTMGTAFLPWLKRPGLALTTNLYLAPRLKKE